MRVTRFETRRVLTIALTGVTLTAGTGCDKAKALARASVVDPDQVAGTAATAAAPLDLAKKPNILFEIFGERDEPRMVPLAVLDGKQLHNIELISNGWHQFDRLYNRPGTTYTVYHDGQAAGTVTVKQGMWTHPDAPLYTLPNCQNLVPLSSVALDGKMAAGITVELLASNATLTSARAGVMMPTAMTARLARQIGTKVATSAGVPAPRLDSLDFRALAINTGATSEPTLVASFIDPNAEEAAVAGDPTSYTFVIADKGSGSAEYTPTFTYIVNGSATRAEFRRYVDHLDIDGDGVDEIVLEAWKYGGDSYPVVLKYAGGRWHEIFRGAPNWCLDPKR